MDWDWDEGPSRGTPRRPDEPPQSPAPERLAPEPSGPDSTFSGAVEHFERPLPRDREAAPPPDRDEPAYLDGESTQVIRRSQEPDEPAPDAASFAAAVDRFESPAAYREPYGPDLERPRPPANEAAQRSPASGREAEGDHAARRPRAPVDRAAQRARRRRQVRRRRLTALVVLVVIVVVIVVLVVRGCGGPAAGQAAGLGASPKPEALRKPTAADPLRMAAYGESVGGGALLGIKLLTQDRKDIKVHRFVKVSSGLTRPDFFDWPAYLEQDMAKRKQPFEAVAIMVGANDAQDTVVDGEKLAFGSNAWDAMYAERVGAVMDFYVKRGVRRVYWAGMPRMGQKAFSTRMEKLNAVYKAEAAKRAPWVRYIDAWKSVDAPATTYQAGLRQSDGVHLTTEGGMNAAGAIMAAVAEDWQLPAFEGESQ